MSRRPFTAPPDDQRCQADRKPLADGTPARCMHRSVSGGFCRQHQPPGREDSDDFDRRAVEEAYKQTGAAQGLPLNRAFLYGARWGRGQP